jgi:hypothetical protein
MCACNACVLQCRGAPSACSEHQHCIAALRALPLRCALWQPGFLGTRKPAPEALHARGCGCRFIERGRPGMCDCALRAAAALAVWVLELSAEQKAYRLTGKAGRREGGGGADPRAGEGGHGPGGGLARRRGLVRREGRPCCANVSEGVRHVLAGCRAVWAWPSWAWC